MTAPDRVAVEAAARVRAFLNAWDAAGLRNNIRFFEPDPTAIPAHMEKLTGSDLRAVLAELERVEQERDGATGLAALLNQIWASGAVVIPQVSREFEVSYSVSWRFNNREHVKRVEWDYDAQEWRALPAEQEAADLAERDEPGGDSR